MEQPCHKCGQNVEEGVTFCPHCGAPQIRVLISEPAAAAIVHSASGESEVTNSSPTPEAVVPSGWSAVFRPSILAAGVASLLTVLRLYPAVAVITAGFLAVLFYRQRWPGSTIKAGTGIRLGALSGLLWFAIISIIGAVQVLYLHKGPEFRESLVKLVDQAIAQTPDPQTLSSLNFLKTSSGLEFLMIALLIFGLFVAIFLAIIGGVLGRSILGRGGKN